MIRVLQVVALAAGDSVAGRGVNGPELRSLNMVRWIDPSRVELTVAYSRRGRLWERFLSSGARVVEFDPGGKFSGRAAQHLRRLVRQLDVDVVHTQGPGSLDLHAARGVAGTRATLMVTRPVMIEDLLASPWRRAAYAWVDGFTLRRAGLVVAVSEDGLRRLRGLRALSPERVRLIHNGVDLARFRTGLPGDRTRFGLKAFGPVIGMSAQLTPPKCWPDFLSVVRRVREERPELQALVIGDGPLRAQLTATVADLGLEEAVRFTGHLDDVAAALACLDVYVSTSRREGLSVAIIEAMAAGLPCVIADAGGARELVVDGQNGFVLQRGEVAGLGRRVAELLGSPELARRMGQAGRLRAEEMFDERVMTSRYQQAYEDIVWSGRDR